MKRKICVVTGSRAEYGLLRPLLQEIKNDKSLDLQLIVTGAHLLARFGFTYKEIEKDRFQVNAKVYMPLTNDDPKDILNAMSKELTGLAKVYSSLKPDLILILGDRYEILIAAICAMLLKIPIAHLNGGERTEGSIDEAMRHAITKISHIHFTATEEYRKRVIQLGEDPKRVFNVGEIGLENIKELSLLEKGELEKALKFKFNKRNLLITYHPETLSKESPGQQFQVLLDALGSIKETNFIFTKTNADAGGSVINKMIDNYVRKHTEDSRAFVSMGQLLYLSTLKQVDALVGNSSSGIVEAPSFKKAAINIGNRQKGRVRAVNAIDCLCKKEDILKALKKADSISFRKVLKACKNPYFKEGSIAKVKNIIKKIDLSSILNKRFVDREGTK